jgi:diphosphomevalonate decarboxylase
VSNQAPRRRRIGSNNSRLLVREQEKASVRKASAVAHANLAFVKYWGKANAELNLPLNKSIAMNLSGAQTHTTVAFSDRLASDEVFLDDEQLDPTSSFWRRVTRQLDRIRALASVEAAASVHSRNTFPAGVGIASSASGMAALTVAGAAALKLDLSERELSILARLGSGSASRSIPGGFVEWLVGDDSESSYSHQIAAPEHWEIADVAVVVSASEKAMSSSDGHLLALNSPFFDARLASLPDRLDTMRTAILSRDFETFGRELEAEAISLHAIAMTSAWEGSGAWHSGIYYWTPATVELIQASQNWRRDGLQVYFTLDAGPTVHLICLKSQQPTVIDAVRALEKRKRNRQWTLIESEPARGAYVTDDPK